MFDAKVIQFPTIATRRPAPDPEVIAAIGRAREVADALQARPPASMSRRQWMERRLNERAAAARDLDVARILRNQADWIALSMRTSQIYLPPLPEEVEYTPAPVEPIADLPAGYDPRQRPILLTPLILVIVAAAAAIAAMPAWWV